MSNFIAVIANERFAPGLVAFLNSYKLSGSKTPIVLIDTGLEKKYPVYTIKKQFSHNRFSSWQNKIAKAEWMYDYSPYLQIELGELLAEVCADEILYLEADMLVLDNIDHLFDYITENNFISVMDDAAAIIDCEAASDLFVIDSAGRYFREGSELRNKYKHHKGWNGGLIGGTRDMYCQMQGCFYEYLEEYEPQYRLLAQSYINQYFIENDIIVRDIGFQYNFSGINEYYEMPELYTIKQYPDGYNVRFMNFPVSIPHFTGKNKPFFSKEKNVMSPVFDFYYNEGRLL